MYTFWSQIDGSGQLSSQHLARGTRTNTLTASTDNIKVTETIGDRVGGYNFLPTLIASRSRRKQCPLYSAHPMGQTESSLLGCAGSEGYSQDWSPSSLRAPQHKPNDSTRIGTGQSSCRGRVRCQSLFIARERRRCEPGSNSVIVTNALTSVEGHVLRLGGVLRTRKIFVGCPANRSFWDQSPKRSTLRSETVGSRLYPLHGLTRLCCFAAEPKIQDRSRAKTGPNTAPGFLRVYNSIKHTNSPLPRWERARVRVTPQTPPSFPHRREPRGAVPRAASPLPRWERVRACPGLEPGVRVKPQTPTQQQQEQQHVCRHTGQTA